MLRFSAGDEAYLGRPHFKDVPDFFDWDAYEADRNRVLEALDMGYSPDNIPGLSSTFSACYFAWVEFLKAADKIYNVDCLYYIRNCMSIKDFATITDDNAEFQLKYDLSYDIKYLDYRELIPPRGIILPGRLMFPWKLEPKADIRDYCFEEYPYDPEIVSEIKAYMVKEIQKYGCSIIPPDDLEAYQLIRSSKVVVDGQKTYNWKGGIKEWVTPDVFRFYQSFVQKDAVDSRDCVICDQETLSSIVWQDRILAQALKRWPLDALNQGVDTDEMSAKLFKKHRDLYFGLLDLKKCGLTIPRWAITSFWEAMGQVYDVDEFKKIASLWDKPLVWMTDSGHWEQTKRGSFLGMQNRSTSAIMSLIWRFFAKREGLLRQGIFYNDDSVIVVPEKRNWDDYLSFLTKIGFFINEKKTCLGRGGFEMCKRAWGAEGREDRMFWLFSLYSFHWSVRDYQEGKQTLYNYALTYWRGEMGLTEEEFGKAFTYAAQRLGYINPIEFRIHINLGGWRFDRTLNDPTAITVGLVFKEKLSKEPHKIIDRSTPDMPEDLASCWQARATFPKSRAWRLWRRSLYRFEAYPVDTTHVEFVPSVYTPAVTLEFGERFRRFSSLQCQIGKMKRESGQWSPYLGATYNCAMYDLEDHDFEEIYNKVAPYCDDPMGVVYTCLEENWDPICIGKPHAYEPYPGHIIHTWHGSIFSHLDLTSEEEYYTWVNSRKGREWLLAVDELMALDDPTLAEVARDMNMPWCFLAPQAETIPEVDIEDDPVLEMEPDEDTSEDPTPVLPDYDIGEDFSDLGSDTEPESSTSSYDIPYVDEYFEDVTDQDSDPPDE